MFSRPSVVFYKHYIFPGIIVVFREFRGTHSLHKIVNYNKITFAKLNLFDSKNWNIMVRYFCDEDDSVPQVFNLRRKAALKSHLFWWLVLLSTYFQAPCFPLLSYNIFWEIRFLKWIKLLLHQILYKQILWNTYITYKGI